MSENNPDFPLELSGPAAEFFNRKSRYCLDELVVRLGEHPVACGGHADVWKGQFENRGVAVKVLRPWSNSGASIQREKLLTRLWREYSAWSSLSHPNVIELLGFSFKFSPDWFIFPSLISPWMSNGTVDAYIETAHLSDLDHLQMLIGIAQGLSYLHTHEPPIIHGDLRAGNVLVSDRGDPCLSDFGLSRILSETRQTPTSSDPAGSLRWMSPELFRGEGGVTAQSDVWAFGMTMLEVLTREQPYSTAKSDAYVFGQINDGHTPARPEDPDISHLLTDSLWQMCSQCWSFEPTERPSMLELLGRLTTHLESSLEPPRSLYYVGTEQLERSGSATPQGHSSRVVRDTSQRSVRLRVSMSPARRQSPRRLQDISNHGRPRRRSTSPSMIPPLEKPAQTTKSFDHPPPRQTALNAPATEQLIRTSRTSSSGDLYDLARLLGSIGSEIDLSVRQLFRCFEALVDVKVCVDDCKRLHRRCVALLYNLRNSYTYPPPLMIELTEILIYQVWAAIHTWSTWSRTKSFLHRSKIVHGLRKLHEQVSEHAIVLAVQHPENWPLQPQDIAVVVDPSSPTWPRPLWPALRGPLVVNSAPEGRFEDSLRFPSLPRSRSRSPRRAHVSRHSRSRSRSRSPPVPIVMPRYSRSRSRSPRRARVLGHSRHQSRSRSPPMQMIMHRRPGTRSRSRSPQIIMQRRPGTRSRSRSPQIIRPVVPGRSRSRSPRVGWHTVEPRRPRSRSHSSSTVPRLRHSVSYSPPVPQSIVIGPGTRSRSRSRTSYVPHARASRRSPSPHITPIVVPRHLRTYSRHPSRRVKSPRRYYPRSVHRAQNSTTVLHPRLQQPVVVTTNRSLSPIRVGVPTRSTRRSRRVVIVDSPRSQRVIVARSRSRSLSRSRSRSMERRLSPEHARFHSSQPIITHSGGSRYFSNSRSRSRSPRVISLSELYNVPVADAMERDLTQGIFPKENEGCLDGRITRVGNQPSSFGGSADVWEGKLGEKKVAIKSTRFFTHRGTRGQAQKIHEKLWLKYTAASAASHLNVLPILGFSWEISPESFIFPSLITPWMSNGTLSSYLERNTDADVYELVLGIAHGLAYLHKQEPPNIHGDVRAENILVSASGVPCLSDLRLSKIIKVEGVRTSADIVGSLRWISPELIHYDTEPDTASDVWAYGMTILEVASRNVPYQDVKVSSAVLDRIRNGVLPARPDSSTLSDDMWALCLKCWTVYAPHRPSMQAVLSVLNNMPRPGRPAESPIAEGKARVASVTS